MSELQAQSLRNRKSYRRGPNAAETALMVLAERNDVELTRRGYPDYMVLQGDDIAGFIEVKPFGSYRLKRGQEAFQRFCARFNIPFAKWCPSMALPDFSTRSDHHLGADQERRRILGIILDESALHTLAGDVRIAGVLDALATKITRDHNQDAEQ